jgi:CRISPR system Cascade subunit CasD
MVSPRDYVMCRLWGPMASWGSIAVGEQRQSWTRPSRSALLGLVAAALGYPRSDAAAHTALEKSLAVAVRLDEPGRSLRDYHTAQSPQAESKRRWHSRYDEINNAKHLNTILSERAYFTEMSAVACIWLRTGYEAPTPSDIVARLKAPVYTLFLGRKASPLGMPLQPQAITAVSLAEAFYAFDQIEVEAAARHKTEKLFLLRNLPRNTKLVSDVWIGAADLGSVGPCAIRERTSRRDSIRDRKTWTFDDRAEMRITLEMPS